MGARIRLLASGYGDSRNHPGRVRDRGIGWQGVGSRPPLSATGGMAGLRSSLVYHPLGSTSATGGMARVTFILVARSPHDARCYRGMARLRSSLVADHRPAARVLPGMARLCSSLVRPDHPPQRNHAHRRTRVKASSETKETARGPGPPGPSLRSNDHQAAGSPATAANRGR